MDSIIMRQPDSGRMTHAMRTGVASRSAGQAMARKRGAAWRGFTPQLRDVEQVCAVLRRTARQGPAGRAATETLAELLRLLPRRSWAGLPVLRVTNQHLASRLSCCIRQVQRHLARLHQLGIIAIDWGRANSRLRWHGHTELQVQDLSSRLSTLRPMGSYRVTLRGTDAGTATPELDLATQSGPLRLSGQGQWLGQRLRFEGEASADEGFEAALSNLLNIIGRREGPRSRLSLG